MLDCAATSGLAATSCREGRHTRRQKDSRKYGVPIPDERLGVISSDRVYGPMHLTSFGDQEYIKPSALPCRDGTLVSQGPEVSKSCLSLGEMRKSTPVGGLLHADLASFYYQNTRGQLPPPTSALELPRDELGEKYWYDNKTGIRRVQPFLALKEYRNKIKAIVFLTHHADNQIVCAAAHIRRATHVVS